jgi:5-methylcytosine-specific restriction protein B
MEPARLGEYFYLCHGNEEPAVLLLGQFSGPPNVFSDRGEGWAERPFRWIKTSVSRKKYSGEHKQWAPNDNSTFIMVPPNEMKMFEFEILNPYFEIKLKQFGVDA